MKIYFIPGLGFDRRIFEKLEFNRIPTGHIQWLEPEVNESFKNYTKRLASSIEDRYDDIVLVGHSFGGLISQEIARYKKIDKVILLSSIQSRMELPFHFKIVHPLNLQRFFSKEFTLRTFPFWSKQHGYVSREEQNLFKDMIAKNSNTYLKWALKELSKWDSPAIPKATEVYQIHGAKDKTFPAKLIKNADYLIPDAGHFMVYKQPKIISDIIYETLHKKKQKA